MDKVYYQLYWKNLNKLYAGSSDIEYILTVFQLSSFKKDLELRIIQRKNIVTTWENIDKEFCN